MPEECEHKWNVGRGLLIGGRLSEGRLANPGKCRLAKTEEDDDQDNH